MTWTPSILPVRVLGKCFGYDSDILQGMRWAAGLHVAGVPDNLDHPAKIINLSLGASGSCKSSYKSVIGELSAIGVLVVASAGNSDGPVESPGNCPGVVAVAGLRHLGTKVGYSSFGTQVTLAAPGGNCVNAAGPCLFSLETTTNDGTMNPAGSSYTDQFNYNVGTSFSAPFVSAIAALMQGANAGLAAPSDLTVPRLIARLQEGVRPFPAPAGVPNCRVGAATPEEGCACTTSTCGAGMANAAGSVTAALRPVADIALPASVTGGQDVVLDGSGSTAADGGALTYSWTAVCSTPTITGADTATATVVAPRSGSFAVRLTVTDDQTAQYSTDITITHSSAELAAPGTSGVCQAASGGGGGGGACGAARSADTCCGSGFSRDRISRRG